MRLMNEFSMQIELLSCCCCSSELRGGGDVALEGSVVDLGTVVVQKWHDWLVHGTVPLHVSWVSVSVSVHILMVLMVDWVLACSPLAVSIWNWWVSWQHASHCPLEQVWVVNQSLGVPLMVPEDNWAVMAETTTTTSDAVVDDPEVGESATSVEVLDWELTDGKESEDDSQLSLSGNCGPVEVRLEDWSGDFSELTLWEPALDLQSNKQ